MPHFFAADVSVIAHFESDTDFGPLMNALDKVRPEGWRDIGGGAYESPSTTRYDLLPIEKVTLFFSKVTLSPFTAGTHVEIRQYAGLISLTDAQLALPVPSYVPRRAGTSPANWSEYGNEFKVVDGFLGMLGNCNIMETSDGVDYWPGSVLDQLITEGYMVKDKTFWPAEE